MGKTASAASRQMTNTRQSASKALLARKARENAAPMLDGDDTLEAMFPQAVPDASDVQPQTALSSIEYIEPAASDAGGAAEAPSPALPSWLEASAAAAAQPLPQAPSWSEEDERALQAMLARRKAAGYQRRGRDVGGQRLQAGQVKPNANTVSATIVELVTGRGSVTRAELLDMMAVATFPHAKAKPTDRGWCQGWVAGALRDNFLALCPTGEAEESAQ